MTVRRKPDVRFSRRTYEPKATVRRRPKARFFLILGATLAVAVLMLVLVLRSGATAPVEWASADFSASYDMLIIRTEVVYEGKNYGKTDFIAGEGQHIETGAPIAEVYSWEYNDEKLSQLLDIQKKILDYEVQVRRAGVIDEKLNDINSRINGKVDQIQQAVKQKQPQNLLPLQRELETILDERTAYLKNVVEPDDTLRGYYNEESSILKTIAAWRTQLTATDNGTVSFYFDGCESLMTPKNIGSFTKKALGEVSAGKTIETEQDDAAYAPLYRIVNENDWYVVMYAEKAIPEMHKGNVFSLIFDDYVNKQYSGVVCDATALEENGGFVYTIRIQDNIGPLVGERRVSAKLAGKQEGFRVLKSCVKTTGEGVSYVETPEGGAIPVLVIADSGQYYLVQTYEGQASLTVGQRLKS